MFTLKKTTMLLLLIITLLPVSRIQVVANEKSSSTDIAYFEFASGGKKANMTAEMGDASTPVIVEQDGREGWQLTKTDNYLSNNVTINLDLASNFAYDVNDGSTFEIEIDYFDGVQRWAFSLVYAAQDRPNRYAGVVRREAGTKGEKNEVEMWRTATFRIQDAKFDNSLDKVDFQITANVQNGNHDITTSTPNGYGEESLFGPNYAQYYLNNQNRVATIDPVIIGAVRVRKLPNKNPFNLKVTMDSVSNHLFDEETAKFHFDMKNLFANSYDLNAEYVIYDANNRVISTKTDAVTIGANEEKKFTVDLGEVPFGLLRMESKFRADGVENVTVTNFSKSREAKIQNEKIGTNVHFEGSDRYKNNISEIVNLISRAGYSTIRDCTRWTEFEPSNNNYRLPPMVKEGMEETAKKGIDYLCITTDNNDAINTESVFPPKQEQNLNEFKDFVSYVTKTFEGRLDGIEFYNEFNIQYPTATVQEQLGLLKATYEGVKAVNPDVKVLGFDSAGLSLRDMRRMFEAGGLDYMDGVSYHPYYHSRGPELAKVFANAQAVEALLEEFGKPEAEIWITENGWTTWLDNMITEVDQAEYHVATILQMSAFDLIDKYYFYEFADSGISEWRMNCLFGTVNAVYDEVPYSAKPAYPAISNANYQLGGTEFVEALGGLSTAASDFIYKYKRSNADGKGNDMVILWTTDERKEMGLDLGCDKVTMYDFYGNESELYGIDGKYSFAASYQPIYLVGEFDNFKQCEPMIQTDGLIKKGASNDTVKQTIRMPNSDDATIVLEGSTYFETEELPTFANGSAIFSAKTPNEQFFNKSIQYRIEKDGKIYYHGNISVESAETFSVIVDHVVNRGNLDHWQLLVDVTNNRNSTAISGIVRVNQPLEFAEVLQDLTFSDLKPQETKHFEVFLPTIVSKEMRNFNMDAILSTGERITIEKKLFFTVAKNKGLQVPTIDGVASSGEYDPKTWFTITSIDGGSNYMTLYDSGQVWKGTDDLSAKMNVAYNKDYLYVFIEVTDDVFRNQNADQKIWNGDSIQLGISDESQKTGSNYCEMSIGLGVNGPQVYRNLTNNQKMVGLVENLNIQILRNGNKTSYELALPWSEVLADPALASAGYRPRFAVLINEDDGLGRNSYMEYSQTLGAIGTYKETGYFSELYLED